VPMAVRCSSIGALNSNLRGELPADIRSATHAFIITCRG
jgi:hypothetical protein